MPELLHERKTSLLSASARGLLQALEYRPTGVRQLATVTGLSEPQVGRGLLTLERKGLVSRLVSGWQLSEKGREVLEQL
jgi:DNA-binding IclR family transcriptional regulator